MLARFIDGKVQNFNILDWNL